MAMKIIRIRRTPASAFNKHRPVSDLIKSQVRHAHQELQRWIETNGRVDPAQIETEQQASEYLAMVTRVLHPEVAGKPRLPESRDGKSGISLSAPQPAQATAKPRGRRSTRAAKRRRS